MDPDAGDTQQNRKTPEDCERIMLQPPALPSPADRALCATEQHFASAVPGSDKERNGLGRERVERSGTRATIRLDGRLLTQR